MQQIEILRHGENDQCRCSLPCDQTRGQDPGQTNASSGMNLEAKLLFQKHTPHFPRQQQRNELEKKIFHAAISYWR